MSQSSQGLVRTAHVARGGAPIKGCQTDFVEADDDPPTYLGDDNASTEMEFRMLQPDQ